ncbi:hypothetical protein SAMN05216388_10232 [Halorientalis persicus]|jgi:hypothetical protein|uniref:Uncharacterized protein n=1 Tax=Halorientalis persicus TaxID=1367881 RepID=A0A1H8TKJ3_9EURY|nr:hypothetical protein SAMN05216388_10232 [Halorientalis persicus]
MSFGPKEQGAVANLPQNFAVVGKFLWGRTVG